MIKCVYCYEAESEHPTAWCKEFKPKEPKVYPEEELRRELAEAQESYRLANLRICELIGAKIVLTKQHDELAAALDVARVYVTAMARDGECGGPISAWLAKDTLAQLADPAAILAAREKPLRDALTKLLQSHRTLAGHRNICESLDDGESCTCGLAEAEELAEEALAGAPEAKP